MTDNKHQWLRTIGFCGLCLSICLIVVLVEWYVDPFLRFGSPKTDVAYAWGCEEYVSSGLLRNYDYDTIITGNSYTDAIKPVAWDKTYNHKSVKIHLAAATNLELQELIRLGLEAKNGGVRQVVLSLDYGNFLSDKDYRAHNLENSLDWVRQYDIASDIKYFSNQYTMKWTLKDLYRTFKGLSAETMDDYINFKGFKYGNFKGVKLKADKTIEQPGLSEEEKIQLLENVEQNIVSIIKDYPEVEFKIYFSPDSILFWDTYIGQGFFQKECEIEELVLSALSGFDNVSLYCFTDDLNLITNMDWYRDAGHYNSDMGAAILEGLEGDAYRVTAADIEEHCAAQRKLLWDFDYEGFIAELNGD